MKNFEKVRKTEKNIEIHIKTEKINGKQKEKIFFSR